MSAYLPIFPLKLVVFPGEKLNLHIFEERYRQLVRECAVEGKTFGIPPYIDGKLQSFGTEIKLLEISKTYEDGKMDIKTEGVGIFRIDNFDNEAPSKLYSGAEITRMPLDYEGDFMKVNKIIEQMEELFAVLNINKPIPPNTPQFTSYEVAHHVGFNINQEYEFLRIPSEIDRQDYMLKHFDKLIPVVREMEELRKRVQMNGHFKNLKPPF